MGAALDLLHHLRGAGLVLTLTPTGGLHVAPRTALTDDHRAAIRADRDALALALAAEALTEPAADLAAADLERDADLACWPHSRAMNGGEIATFEQRRRRFAALGMSELEAEALADRLVRRDRDGDDMRACSECRHLSDGDRRASRWYCREYRAAGLGTPALCRELVTQPHRCAGFAAADTAATPRTL